MKEISNYQRTVNYLVKIFKSVNEYFFDNELEQPTITVQSTVGAYGHITTSKIWNNNGIATYELNIGAETLNRPIENVVATMVHECVHLYCLMNDIKDTSNRGVYHNKKFKEIAENKGKLKISKHEKYGWTLTEPTENTLEMVISYGFDDILINRQTEYTFRPIGIGKNGNGNTDTIETPKRKSSIKMTCPFCGNIARVTKKTNLICGDCMQNMIEE